MFVELVCDADAVTEYLTKDEDGEPQQPSGVAANHNGGDHDSR
jgi:hypothetical protein